MRGGWRCRIALRLSPASPDALESDWRSIARPEQLPPEGDWSIWIYLAGRGAGKTRSGAEAVRDWIESGCGRVALIAPTQGDARDVMAEGESGLLAIAPDSNRPSYEPSKRRLTWPNGAMDDVQRRGRRTASRTAA